MSRLSNDVTSAARRKRAIGYARVSTKRQAAHEVSLGEQQAKIAATCTLKDADLVSTFVEPGRSATSDQRPVFRELIAYACDPANTIDLVIVYAFSRFFRDTRQYLHYKEVLRRVGVRLVSATQDIPEGPHGGLMETIIAAFDDHQSEVNAETVRDNMGANAEAGYWNGSSPPFGYWTEIALSLRNKDKKRLVVDEEEAVIVRMIFRLYLLGPPGGAPLGIKSLCEHLNREGTTYRKGKRFYTSLVEAILKREFYASGLHHWNKMDSRTRKARPPSEWVPIKVPPIIDQAVFDAARRRLTDNRPVNTPPRVVTGPTLLTDLAVCVSCDRGMMLRTGKSGRYRYLTCAKSATEGNCIGCGRSLPMDVIDELVLGAVEATVLAPVRLEQLLRAASERSDENRAALKADLVRLRRRRSEAEAGLTRHYEAIEKGVASLDEPVLKQRIDELRLQASEARTRIAGLEAQRSCPPVALTPEVVQRASTEIRKHLREGPPELRKTWLRHFVNRVDVHPDRIVIHGPKSVLIDALSGKPDRIGPMVPSFDRKWRGYQESNLGIQLGDQTFGGGESINRNRRL